jgi:hypothetical protein
MTLNGIRKRLDGLETNPAVTGCLVCREWPEHPAVFLRAGDPLPEKSDCPACGRRVRVVVVFDVVPSNAQETETNP